ncbi:MAG: HNH endonuclease signature motif containing protein, partial [Acidimicrobiia bacterium]
EEGRPLALGRNTRVIPRKLRKHILSRDQGCTSDGCPSTYRLQIHHIIPISQGGLTVEQNLITLCWYHHQIAIHQQGLQVQKLGPSRIRLVPPT